jgi:hypothetical protein
MFCSFVRSSELKPATIPVPNSMSAIYIDMMQFCDVLGPFWGNEMSDESVPLLYYTGVQHNSYEYGWILGDSTGTY